MLLLCPVVTSPAWGRGRAGAQQLPPGSHVGVNQDGGQQTWAHRGHRHSKRALANMHQGWQGAPPPREDHGTSCTVPHLPRAPTIRSPREFVWRWRVWGGMAWPEGQQAQGLQKLCHLLSFQPHRIPGGPGPSYCAEGEPGLLGMKGQAQDTDVSMTHALGGLFHYPKDS